MVNGLHLVQMEETSAVKIRLADISKRFGENQVLSDISFDIAAGRNTALIGGAASGKTVLLKCLLGIYPVDSGTIEIDGTDTTNISGDDRIRILNRFGVLFQRSALFDSMTVWENIAFKLVQAAGMGREQARELAVQKLAQVGMTEDVAALYPADLSGGMQKRVALARAVVDDPEILVLDDPTAGLDPILTRSINRLITHSVRGEDRGGGTTVLSVTGDMDSVRRDYDNVVMIHDGRVIWTGDVADIDSSENPYLLQLVNGRSHGPIKMRLRG